jgi:diguanylate cyclase (GGDEF)-like protein
VSDEHEITRLKRNMNWMAHQIESQTRVMRNRLDKVGMRQQQFQELSYRDPLTNLFNRRYMEEALETLDRKGGDGETFLALMDCDSFKRVNDAQGHRVGDEILVGLGRIIAESVREREDAAFRFGGDEFGVLFRGLNLQECLGACERIRARFEAGNAYGCTVSVGVARFRPGGSSEEMFAASDRALYRAKTDGRNRVVHDTGSHGDHGAGTQAAGPRWGCSGEGWS